MGQEYPEEMLHLRRTLRYDINNICHQYNKVFPIRVNIFNY